jgi:CRISPR-associated endonuclease Csn1
MSIICPVRNPPEIWLARTARLIRRQHWRRGRRLKKIFNLLKSYGLLPEGPVSSPEERQDYLNRVDNSILDSLWFRGRSSDRAFAEPGQVMPYILRAAALDEPLEPHFLGRAFYHLAQRRGFLSNRAETSTTSDEKEEEGKVKSGITELQKSMETSGARTLGEYFARQNPDGQRIRQRWTSRAMYEHEFDAIWASQVRFHPRLLTSERKKILRMALFSQRPLKVQKYLIGECELEPGERRAGRYLLLSQRFRMLQKANDLRILANDGSERRLTADERNKLLEALELGGDQTFPAIRKLLGLNKTTHFNLEEGGETKLPGNRTASQMYSAFGDRWLGMSAPEKDFAVEYLHGFQRTDKLRPAAMRKFSLDETAAEKFASVKLEADYFGLSRRAMEKLLPSLEEGASYADAQFNAYGEREEHQLVDLLPPVEQWRAIRNPGVTRSLTQLRRVVNAIIRQYGRPMEIRIELARDLRQTKTQREKTWKKNRENQRSRDKAAKRILDEVGLSQPSNDDIRKVLLAEECNFMCPYSGRTISMSALVGRESQYDIEHIIPFSRSLDNSFANLTLCYHEENRNVKRNQTPMEAYASDPERFQEILGRVKGFRPDFAREKLRRFQMTTAEVEEMMKDFTSRQLNDTRYATRLAGDYLALLYGGRVDANGTRRIRATAGQVTAFLRNEWKLNAILQDGPTGNGGAVPKSRDDHRHHAVDAVVTALTDDGTIQALSRAAERAPLERRRRFAVLEGPWPNFAETVRDQIETVVVSHRAQKKVSGALHEETLYSAPRGREAANVRRVRKPLGNLSKSEVNEIADPRVREIVLAKLRELGTQDPGVAFKQPGNLPFLPASDGRPIPIKSVRIIKKLPTFPLGSGRATRYVASESNHHIEIFAELDKDGNEVEWDGDVVSLSEAQRRLRLHQPIIQRQSVPDRKFLFSLSPGEVIVCDSNSGDRAFFVLRKMSHLSTGQIQLGFAPIRDSRQAKIMQAGRAWLWAGPESLRTRHARKVSVGPLCDVSESHD